MLESLQKKKLLQKRTLPKKKCRVQSLSKKIIPVKKTKHLDEGTKEEYIDLSDLESKKRTEDPFSKLKNIAGKTKTTSSEENETKPGEKSKPHHDKQSQELLKNSRASTQTRMFLKN